MQPLYLKDSIKNMKCGIVIILLCASSLAIGQKVVYKLGYQPWKTETEVRAFMDSICSQLPKGYILQPTIIHRNATLDTVFNYISLAGMKSDHPFNPETVSFSFKQDSAYMNLNKMLPVFTHKDVDNKEFKSPDLFGKPAVLFIWSDAISQSFEQFQDLNTVVEKFGTRVNFVDITESTCNPIPIFLEGHTLRFRHLLNADKIIDELIMREARPRFIFVDKDGIIREIQTSMPSKKDQANNKYVYDVQEFSKVIDHLF
jgi:cytochrome c biogenesis protein CcmG, thiol:disulfide interchange protein DsbE